MFSLTLLLLDVEYPVLDGYVVCVVRIIMSVAVSMARPGSRTSVCGSACGVLVQGNGGPGHPG